MTINYKNQGYDLTTTNLTTVLTISASTVAIIKEIAVANDNNAAVQCDFFFRDFSDSVDYKFYHSKPGANSHDNAVHNVLVLEAGDSLKFQADTADKISGQISYALISRVGENG
jgi:hypothetical protein